VYRGARGNLVINIPFRPYLLPLALDGEGAAKIYIEKSGPILHIYLARRDPQQSKEEGIMRISRPDESDEITVVVREGQLNNPVVENVLSFLLKYSRDPRIKEELDKRHEELFYQL
jgi:hypothetical protein